MIINLSMQSKLIPIFVAKYFQLAYSTNKRKIINDPVYGFISIPGDFIYDLIEHPWFQRLRNIRQLGLTSFVYPGANHSRFQHGLGALHLMDMALKTLKGKGCKYFTIRRRSCTDCNTASRYRSRTIFPCT